MVYLSVIGSVISIFLQYNLVLYIGKRDFFKKNHNAGSFETQYNKTQNYRSTTKN